MATTSRVGCAIKIISTVSQTGPQPDSQWNTVLGILNASGRPYTSRPNAYLRFWRTTLSPALNFSGRPTFTGGNLRDAEGITLAEIIKLPRPEFLNTDHKGLGLQVNSIFRGAEGEATTKGAPCPLFPSARRFPDNNSEGPAGSYCCWCCHQTNAVHETTRFGSLSRWSTASKFVRWPGAG